MSTITHPSPETAPVDPEELYRLLPLATEERPAEKLPNEPDFDAIVHGIDPQYDQRVANAKQAEDMPLRDRVKHRLGSFATGAMAWVKGRRSGHTTETGPTVDLSVFDTQPDVLPVEEAPATVPMPVIAEGQYKDEVPHDTSPVSAATALVEDGPESSALVPTRSTRYLGRQAMGETSEDELPPGPDHERHQENLKMAEQLERDIATGTENVKEVLRDHYIPGLEGVVKQIDAAIKASEVKPSPPDSWYVGPASSDEEYTRTISEARDRMADEQRRQEIHEQALARSRIIPHIETATTRVHAVTSLGRGASASRIVDVFAVPESARRTQVDPRDAQRAMGSHMSIVHDLDAPSGRHAAQ